MKIDGNTISAPVDPSQWSPAKDTKKVENFSQILNNAVASKDKKLLYESCQQLESVFLNQVLEAMRATVPKSDLLQKSTADDVFESMLYEEYAEQISKTGSTGLADIIFRQLSQNLK